MEGGPFGRPVRRPWPIITGYPVTRLTGGYRSGPTDGTARTDRFDAAGPFPAVSAQSPAATGPFPADAGPFPPYPEVMTTSPDAHRLSDALDGRRIVLAVDRRTDELAAALERHGAEVSVAAALTTIPHVDDEALLSRTRELIADPPELLVITTGIGMRGWFEAATASGIAEQLREALSGATILARGPKGRGAIQQAGLTAHWVAESETAAEVADHLRTMDVAGRRVAVQHHGSGADGLDELLEEMGAEVVSLTVYRWGPPRDPEAVRRSVHDAATGKLDAVVSTAAPGAARWLEVAREEGVLDGIRERAQAGDLVLAVVGPVNAGPYEDQDIPVLQPERMRLGSMVKAIVQHYAEQSRP